MKMAFSSVVFLPKPITQSNHKENRGTRIEEHATKYLTSIPPELSRSARGTVAARREFEDLATRCNVVPGWDPGTTKGY